MSSPAWNFVARALLGSWPSQVASWGREALGAYLHELEARGLSPEDALVAIRACSADHKFPPSAPELAALARQDPSRPTFDELLTQLYGPGGVFGFKRSDVVLSPWVLKFVEDKRDWLRNLPIDDDDEGKWERIRLKESWDAFCQATEGRAVHEIASRSGRGALGRLDPLAVLGLTAPEIESGE